MFTAAVKKRTLLLESRILVIELAIIILSGNFKNSP